MKIKNIVARINIEYYLTLKNGETETVTCELLAPPDFQESKNGTYQFTMQHCIKSNKESIYSFKNLNVLEKIDTENK